MTNKDVLNRFRTFRAVKLQPVWSYRYERCLISQNEHFMKEGHVQASNFRQLWEGIFPLLFVSRTKTRVLRTRVDLYYYCGPFPACVGELFQYLWVQTLFLKTFEDIQLCSTHTSIRVCVHTRVLVHICIGMLAVPINAYKIYTGLL